MRKSILPSIVSARRGPALLSAIGEQLETVPPAVPSPGAANPAERQSPVKPAPFVLRLSADVFRQIDTAAVARGVTMTVVIAEALKGAGFVVPDEDLVDRRKRRFR